MYKADSYPSLTLNIFLHNIGRYVSCRTQEVRGRPQRRHSTQGGKLLPHDSRSVALDQPNNLSRSHVGRHAAKQVNVVRHHFQCSDLAAQCFHALTDKSIQSGANVPNQTAAGVFTIVQERLKYPGFPDTIALVPVPYVLEDAPFRPVVERGRLNGDRWYGVPSGDLIGRVQPKYYADWNL